MNPNETRGTEVEVEQACPSCGMDKKDWPSAQGFTKDKDLYCCEGCAEGTGCTCE